jgi:glutamate synthase domain-containing protein 3
MNFTQAMVVISEIKENFGEGLLETLQYMQDNLDDFSDNEQRAFRTVMRDFRALLTPA